jgi:hypothetical protein
MPADLAATIGGTSGKAPACISTYDTAFAARRPARENKLWAWGAIGKTPCI